MNRFVFRKTLRVDNQIVVNAVIPVPVEIVFDEAGSLLIAFPDQVAGTVRVEPLALGPTLDTIFKGGDDSGTQDAVDVLEEVLTATPVNDDVAF